MSGSASFFWASKPMRESAMYAAPTPTRFARPSSCVLFASSRQRRTMKSSVLSSSFFCMSFSEEMLSPSFASSYCQTR